jgi:hypothetical protein
MYSRLPYVSRGALPIKTLVLYIYRLRSTMQNNQQLYAIYSSYNIVHTVNGSPLSVVGYDTLSSDSFYVSDISLVLDLIMQLMSAGQITDHDCNVIFDPDVCYI